MADELVSALKRWRLRCPKGEHDLICPNARGLPMQSSDVLRTGLHTLRRAGIRQVRFHDLRHSFASNLLAAGVDVVTVSKALGHANVSHHVGDLRARDSEGAARRGRCTGAAHGTEWKQSGKIEPRNSVRSLIE